MLDGDEQKEFCSWLENVKFLDGFMSNIANYVNVSHCKISRMKSHDSHIFMQILLPTVMGIYLRDDIRLALMELSTFFKKLCAQTCKKKVIKCLELEIIFILYKLERYSHQAFLL